MGPFGPPGPTGATGPTGPPDKTAILPWRGEFVGLFCVESPSVRFEDVVRVVLQGPETVHRIDPTFLDCCEPGSVEVVGVVSPLPTLIGAEIVDNLVRVRVSGRPPDYVVLTLSGIRAGRRDVRFPRYSESQMHRNNEFWGQAHG